MIVRIYDPERTTLFRASLRTSRFGIASFDWSIPQTARAGQYDIDVEIEEGEYDRSESQQVIKISRYDLPNFTVSAKADRPYYLPGQNAEVEVRADYLFGEPVKSGRVRVVRESSREWNYREQKWEIEEGDSYEGVLDQSNRFIAKINLEEDHSDLADSDYSRMRDISYAAYVTDATTERTERRLIDIRVTKNPIHVYLIEANNRQTEDFPMQFYVSTFYADGSPAQCDVEIRQSVEANNDQRANAARGELLTKVKTNRYGLAKVSNLTVDSEPEFELIASDRAGRRGSEKKDWGYFSHRPVIRVETGRTLYRAGEAIKAEIISSAQTGALFVEVSRGYRGITSQLARLSRGRATVSFPYRKEFEGEISIAAYLIDGNEDETTDGLRTVLYPAGRKLKLEARGKKEYRPGEEASMNLAVRGAEGASALGVVVYDKAVEERARADQKFGYSGGFLDWFRDEDQRFGEVRRQDIERLDLTKPLPEGLEMVAEVLLNRDSRGWLNAFEGQEYEAGVHKVFSGMLFWQMLSVRAALDPRYNNNDEHPTNIASLKRILADAGIDFDAMRDPWDTPFRAEFSIQTTRDAMLALLLKQDARSSAAAGQAEIFVNGRRAASVDLPAGRELTGPVMIDLSGFLQTGANRIEIKRGAGSMAATAQLVTVHYEPWNRANDTSVKMESSSAMRLKVNFDKTEARAGEEITCRVEAERIGFHGYGMMLAEVGLPPGMDVDRASLDLAMTESGWDISQYDVLPDRVIVYLWPRAGGTKFEFKFKPRYGLRAQNAPSTIYDYYNPEARATVAPVKFIVR